MAEAMPLLQTETLPFDDIYNSPLSDKDAAVMIRREYGLLAECSCW